MRRHVLILGAVFVFEAALYSALTPLLASYAEHGQISRLSAGVLNGAYAFGLIPGSIAAARIARGAGVRTTTIVGALLFACATGAFAFASGLPELDIARVAQGIAAGCMWGGALAWLMDVAPSGREGEFVGIGAGASTFGAIAGPLLGIVAVEVGKKPTYVGCAVAVAVLMIPLRVHLSAPPPQRAVTTTALDAVKNSLSLRRGVWISLCVSVCFAILITLLPLRLEEAGAAPSVVGVIFLIAAAVSAVAARPAGTLSDRFGSDRSARVGLVAAAGLLLLLAFDLPLIPLAIATVCAAAVLFTGVAIPAEHLLFIGAAEGRSSASVSASALLLCVAVGETVGAPIGAALATAAGDAAPFLFLASLLVGLSFYVARYVGATGSAR